MFGLLQITIAALIVARLLVPTEASVRGDTLWLVQLWLAAGLLWGRDAFLRRDFRLRLGAVDLAVWLIVAGHVVSALAVFEIGGDRRAAVNMAWEWIGLGVSFCLVRQVLRTRSDAHRLLLVLVVTAAALGVLGIWQHYVSNPRLAQEYTQIRGELDRLQQAPPPENPREAFLRQQRIRTLQAELLRQDVPLEGPGRALFMDRIQSSHPFGTFGLANTFAGLLAVWLIVTLGMAVNAWARGAGGQALAGAALATGLLAYCLLLTKGRTAWMGLVAGLLVWGWFAIPRRSASRSTSVPLGPGKRDASPAGTTDPQTVHAADSQAVGSGDAAQGTGGLAIRPAGGPRPFAWGAGASVVVAALLGLAALSGGFDRQVVSEAPKSLRYRMEYWTGAWEVVRERPILGTGPGNFRQHYLKHKLPQSSEEVADPHNFVLDLWTSGGITALLGMAALMLAAAGLFFGRPVRGTDAACPADGTATTQASTAEPASALPESGGPPASERTVARHPYFIGAGLAFVTVLAGRFAFGGVDWTLVGLFAVWLLLAAWLGGRLVGAGVSNACLGAACIALLVHLLGAGGIEMPAVMQTLLVLVAAAAVVAPKRGQAPAEEAELEAAGPAPLFRKASISRPGVLAGAVLMLPLSVACFLTAVSPVLNRQASVAAGDVAFSEDGNPSRAESFYKNAASQDPFSPEPLERLAELAFSLWQASPRTAERHFEEAVRLRALAIELDPFNPNGYRRLGNWHLARFQHTESLTDAEAAARELARATERYPANPALRAELAEAEALAGRQEQAGIHAARALELDAINRAHGHRDRYLPAETVEMLYGLSQEEQNKKKGSGLDETASGI